MADLLDIAREVGASIERAEDGKCPGCAPIRFNRRTLTAYTDAIREECAKVCEEEKVDAEASGSDEDVAYNRAIDHCAAAIRGEGGKTNV